MSDLDDAAARFRRDLLARDARAAAELVRSYATIWQAISRDLDLIQHAIAQRLDAGKPISRGWLAQEARFRSLLADIEPQVASYAARATGQVGAEQQQAIEMARQHAAALAEIAAPAVTSTALTFGGFPNTAVQQLAGTLQAGSPLRTLFDALGPDLSERLRTALLTSVGGGHGPRVTARALRAAAKREAGMTLTRALTISRTETLRSYREATRQTWIAQDPAVERWRWLSARSTRTCGFCWAQDGKTFPLTEAMPSHPNCRCVMVPVTGSARPWQMGADVFAKLDPKKQETILGRGKYAAYHDGRIVLGDLVAWQRSAEWGRTGHEASLKQALAKDEKRRRD